MFILILFEKFKIIILFRDSSKTDKCFFNVTFNNVQEYLEFWEVNHHFHMKNLSKENVVLKICGISNAKKIYTIDFDKVFCQEPLTYLKESGVGVKNVLGAHDLLMLWFFMFRMQ